MMIKMLDIQQIAIQKSCHRVDIHYSIILTRLAALPGMDLLMVEVILIYDYAMWQINMFSFMSQLKEIQLQAILLLMSDFCGLNHCAS